ncbi:MAG: TRAP transporter large permease subunit [Rhizobiales bacterium]|nr:TRAP transporter large permease subunit [Hyphomicrobiales bacterium]
MKSISFNKIQGFVRLILSLIIVFVVLYVSVFGVFNDSYLRVGMLLFAGFIILLDIEPGEKTLFMKVMPLVLAVLLAAGVMQYFSAAEEIETGLYFLTQRDIWLGIAGIVAVFELTRRSVGLIMASVSVVLFLYGIFGDLFPGVIRHAGISIEELIQVLWYSFDGVFGRPMATVVSTILVYIIFGAVLGLVGIDMVLVRLALSATGRLRAGPASAAVVASGLFGTISGSAVARSCQIFCVSSCLKFYSTFK